MHLCVITLLCEFSLPQRSIYFAVAWPFGMTKNVTYMYGQLNLVSSMNEIFAAPIFVLSELADASVSMRSHQLFCNVVEDYHSNNYLIVLILGLPI